MSIAAASRALCGALLAASLGAVPAQQLYRWTDDQGLVHYSDQAPSAAHRQIQLESEAGAASSGKDSDAYSVLNQVRAMEAERLQREQARQAAEMQRLAREQARLEVEAARANASRAEDEAEARRSFVLPPPRPPLRPQPPGHRPVAPTPEPVKPTRRSLKLPSRSLRPPPGGGSQLR
ncbi:DUF4124 domain-containing protein [Thiorhodococcus minor]|uniref:DUF4124 domain-containing protein n=1 Tax=Thiorhodococcus minor TaxID=57489 RepID=A0A6M0JUK9_9GAMM|nr:DUF4124 domain-containing protein [Thiorhodococcus minor]NEV61206.1 DUF4124 domain-containing protein [Thiorhodococcus minor]